VGRINEKHISAIEPIKKREIDIFYLLLDQPTDALDAIDEKLTGIRFDTAKIECPAEHAAIYVGNNQRRETAADLDHHFRPEMAQCRIQELGVQHRILIVAINSGVSFLPSASTGGTKAICPLMLSIHRLKIMPPRISRSS
jgi:hypothetical protein